MAINPNRYDRLLSLMERGKHGGNTGLSVGLDHIKPTIAVRKGIYTIIGGMSGTGKTAIADYFYVLNAYEDAKRKGIPFNVIYFSYERKFEYKLAKWVCARLMKVYGIVMDTENLLYWNGERSTMNPEIYEKVVECKEYFEEMLKSFSIFDAKDNPTGIRNTIYAELLKLGKVHTKPVIKADGTKIEVFVNYTPNDPEQITLIVMDHAGLALKERGFTTKENIDKLSEYLADFRDRYDCGILLIQQFNRNLSDALRKKQNDITPRRDDLKDTSDTENDCDMFLGIIDPLEFNLPIYNDYDASKYQTAEGFRRFRALHVVKNSYGGSGGMIPLAFYGESGLCIPLNKPSLMSGREAHYVQYKRELLYAQQSPSTS